MCSLLSSTQTAVVRTFAGYGAITSEQTSHIMERNIKLANSLADTYKIAMKKISSKDGKKKPNKVAMKKTCAKESKNKKRKH